MCLITFRIEKHPKYKLILAANRDEAYSRPTEAAHFWKESPLLLAGKDLEANGTWLGITKAGKLAAITNCHDDSFNEAILKKKSRGTIVTDYLNSSVRPKDYLQQLMKEKNDYQPFNILLGDVDHLFHFNSQEDAFVPLEAGTHSLSNATLNTPWPKVRNTKKQLDQIVLEEDSYMESLFKMMKDATPAADEDLPDYKMPLDIRRKVSAPFIKTPEFGTRCTTLLFVDHNNHVTFIERVYDSSQQYKDQTFHFDVE